MGHNQDPVKQREAYRKRYATVTAELRKGYYAKAKAEGMCVNCFIRPARAGKTCCEVCAEVAKKRGNAYYQRTREKVFAHYGSVCACCGESEPLFLTIDHINGGGKKHERERKAEGQSRSIYVWLENNDFPEGYRVLCFNCNSGRERNGGICPHEKYKTK